MNNNFPFMGNQAQQFTQMQQMFPQPQGSVYSINTPVEIGNVPIGSTGLSVAICIPENLMYIKSFQNGQPAIMVYRISPFSKESKEAVQSTPSPTNNTDARLSALEQKLDQLMSGGKFDGLL